VWGGAAGCMPTLVGWAAVTGSLSWQPIVLFGVIFFWTPPHTWALAMRYREDYKAAGVPMLPVIATEERVTRQIVVYT
ncbi:UbiA family prenyltransferase, partial [Mycobacterium tuberculosis]|nr:UbiA family prenyltransferase [Mycobacterium tuberculosis]